jgi:hypothetical protein
LRCTFALLSMILNLVTKTSRLQHASIIIYRHVWCFCWCS